MAPAGFFHEEPPECRLSGLIVVLGALKFQIGASLAPTLRLNFGPTLLMFSRLCCLLACQVLSNSSVTDGTTGRWTALTAICFHSSATSLSLRLISCSNHASTFMLSSTSLYLELISCSSHANLLHYLYREVASYILKTNSVLCVLSNCLLALKAVNCF